MGKNADEKLKRKKIEMNLYDAFTRYVDYQYYGAIAEDKLKQVEADKSLETRDGKEKPVKEVYWEYIRFKRGSLQQLREYVKIMNALIVELKASKEEIKQYFKERDVMLSDEEIKGFAEEKVNV